ncbi:MAG: glucuronate isomerase [Lentisphaerae bacterium]|nr:glucuronate isomerase [Lentisphaerota bacterium]
MANLPVTDIHTHLFDPAMGDLLLWGIDELLTYHYLVAEVFRARPDLRADAFWAMPKTGQADLIWQELFVNRSPVSEACRGVVTVLTALGLDPRSRTLAKFRKFFSGFTATRYTDTVLRLAGVEKVFMTNDPLDPAEHPIWTKGFPRDPRFLGVLRLDSAVMNWPDGAPRLMAMGYAVDTSLSGKTMSEIRRYLNDWLVRLDARYMAISLPPTFRYPDVTSPLTDLMVKAVLPVARERNLPVAMMIGVKKLVNPELRLAGDSLGRAEIETVERLARDFGAVRFLVTMLSRENAHELCVAARKFKNILPFGCWWFLNNPSLIRELTAMRLELLGLSFIPQHSDARVLDQLVYKWTHSRAVIGGIFAEQVGRLALSGFRPTAGEIARDIGRLFGGRLLD